MASENITYFFSENTENEQDEDEQLNLTLLLSEFEHLNEFQSSSSSEEDIELSEIKNYELNYTNKQLLLICEYYNLLTKKVRNMKKKELITMIMVFEKDISNYDIVLKRKILWGYLDELKSDKMMSRFIMLW